MSANQILFLAIAALGLAAALGTVLARNLVHAALFLVGFFFVVACEFVLLDAEFLAAIQVLVYIGAVAILLMFGIMLTRNVQGDETTTVPLALVIPAVVLGLALFALLSYGNYSKVRLNGGVARSPWAATELRPALTVDKKGAPADARTSAVNNMGKTVGEQLLTRYALPFEVAGVLLTAALVGAVAVAHRESEVDSMKGPKRSAEAADAGNSEPLAMAGH